MRKIKMTIIVLRVLFMVLMATTVAGCASLGTFNPATGRQEFIVIPTADEVAMGRKMHAQIISQYPISSNQAQIGRLNRIGQRLAQVSDRQDYQYHFFLLESKDINAFTTPGGNIYMFSGLLSQLNSDEEVAAVLAHEIGHCAARHTIKKFQASVGYDFIQGIVLNELGLSEQVRRIAGLSSQAVMSLVFSAYSRQDEYESDRLGLKYMNLAGYPLEGMRKTLQVLEAESHGDSSTLLILRSHPYLKDRIKAVDQEMERIRGGRPSG